MERGNIEKLLSLARELAVDKTDEGLNKAIEILFYTIDEGCEDPEVLVTAGAFLLQSSQAVDLHIREKAIQLVDKAMAFQPEKVPVLEDAIDCYELVLNDFPDKLDDIVKVCFRILEINPDHVESMVILANSRNRLGVTLSLEDAIGMLEWACEVEPDNTLAASTLARLLLEAGRFNEAKTLFSRVIDGLSGPQAIIRQNKIKASRSAKMKIRILRHNRYSRN